MTEYVYGSIDGIGSSLGTYAVMTMDVPWNLVKDRIGGTPASVTMVTGLEHDYLDRLVKEHLRLTQSSVSAEVWHARSQILLRKTQLLVGSGTNNSVSERICHTHGSC